MVSGFFSVFVSDFVSSEPSAFFFLVFLLVVFSSLGASSPADATVQADGEGRYEVLSLPGGAYAVEASSTGFQATCSIAVMPSAWWSA